MAECIFVRRKEQLGKQKADLFEPGRFPHHTSAMPFRLDRFLSLYFFHPLIRKCHKQRGNRIPILMYHSISLELRKGVHPYFEVCTSPEVFESHMMFLHDEGYTSISLPDVGLILAGEKVPPSRPVCITFDDGFRDFLTNAFPLLQKYGHMATVFLPTGFVGNHPMYFMEKKCLSWNDIKALHSEGVAFGSHTVNHVKLVELDSKRLEIEVNESKENIEKELKEEVTCFSYPFAFPAENVDFFPKLKKSLTAAGYQWGVTTIIGQGTEFKEPLFLPRLPINDFDDVPFFKAKLEGAYDWLYGLQGVYKQIREYI